MPSKKKKNKGKGKKNKINNSKTDNKKTTNNNSPLDPNTQNKNSSTSSSSKGSPSVENSDFFYLVDAAKGDIQHSLMKKKVALLEKARDSAVTLRDISDHQLYLNKVIADMNRAKEFLKRKHTITQAMLKRATERKRSETLLKKLEHFKRREIYFNQNVNLINNEIQWFQTSQAFKQAQEYVLNHWKQCKSGAWVNIDELEDDSNVDFDTLLQAMKEEGGFGGGGFGGSSNDADKELKTSAPPTSFLDSSTKL
jgi:hypothetical protein